MRICSLHLTDFRSYPDATVEFGDGLTAIVGENGQGKTNLLEAIGWLAGLGSFRGAPDDALVRTGADTAVVRAVVHTDEGRERLVEGEIARVGRNRIQVDRQRLSRMGDLIGVVPVTVFSPDDLDLVKGGPAGRRTWIDDALGQCSPGQGLAGARSELERVLKQRNALLRSVPGRLDEDAAFTLDVWDTKLAAAGTAVRDARLALLDDLSPALARAYDTVAGEAADVAARYECSWEGSLEEALAEARTLDVRRGVTTVGPHRDEIALAISGRPARTQGSQGEQRSLALALRLAVDATARTAGTRPILLLDDVFSELDPHRSAALLDALPDAQRLLTTASGIPPGARADRVLTVVDGRALDAESGAATASMRSVSDEG